MPLALRPVARRLAGAVLVAAAALHSARSQPPPNPPPTGGSGQLEALQQQVTSLQGQVAELDNLAVMLRTLAGRIDRLQRVQEARAALDEGRPLGEFPNAPPALARFADSPPPTLDALRARFPTAAAAARRASDGSGGDRGFFARLWVRVESLVTVQDGGRVLVGAPAAFILARARATLDAGDVPGTLTALDALDAAARRAMADWIAQAQALRDARIALAAAAAG